MAQIQKLNIPGMGKQYAPRVDFTDEEGGSQLSDRSYYERSDVYHTDTWWGGMVGVLKRQPEHHAYGNHEQQQ